MILSGSRRVVCITDHSDSIKTGPVLISIKNKFSDASDVLFSYVVSTLAALLLVYQFFASMTNVVRTQTRSSDVQNCTS